MNKPAETLTISTLAKATGVNIETVRFYQRKGLMQKPDRPLGGIRHYGSPDLGRLRFIKSAQRLGFSLKEVRDLLKLEDGAHCAEARKQGEQKLADVRARLADLGRIEIALEGLVDRCRVESGRLRCPLIAALETARGNRTG